MGVFSDTIAALTPERDYQFSMATSTSTLVDSGTDTANLASFGDPGTYARIAGPTTYETDFALPTEESGNLRYWVGTAGVNEINHAQGTLIIGWRFRSGWDANLQTLMGYGNTGGAIGLLPYIDTARKVNIRIANTAGVNQHSFLSTGAPIASTDTDWHLLVVRQPADGGGLEVFLDGAVLPGTLTTIGSATADWWFGTISSLTSARSTVARNNNGGNRLDGDLTRIVITDTVITDTQITTLWNNYFTEVTGFDTKSIRRRGRRLFFDFSA